MSVCALDHISDYLFLRHSGCGRILKVRSEFGTIQISSADCCFKSAVQKADYVCIN
jgi:hypothetical protein